MDIMKFYKNFKRPIYVGVAIFATEFALGWLSFILVIIPMIFVLALIVGYFVDTIEDSIVVYSIVLIIGNLLGGLILAIVLFPSWLGPGRIDLGVLGVLFFIAPFMAMSGASTMLNGFALTEFTLIIFLIAPVLYFFSFGFAAVGSRIGNRLRNEELENAEETVKDISTLTKEEESIFSIDSTN